MLIGSKRRTDGGWRTGVELRNRAVSQRSHQLDTRSAQGLMRTIEDKKERR